MCSTNTKFIYKYIQHFLCSHVKGVKQVQSNKKELRRKNMEGGLEEGGGDIYEDGLMLLLYIP